MQIFFVALFTVSVLTGLTVEAIKKMFKDYQMTWHPNLLSAIVSTILSFLASVGWVVYTETLITPQLVVGVLALIFLSWLCSMVGYDKVSQAIAQIKNGGSK